MNLSFWFTMILGIAAKGLTEPLGGGALAVLILSVFLMMLKLS